MNRQTKLRNPIYLLLLDFVQIRVIPHGLILRIDAVRKLLIFAHSPKRNSLIILGDGVKSIIILTLSMISDFVILSFSF